MKPVAGNKLSVSKEGNEQQPGNNFSGDAGERFHFEAGAVECGVRAEPRLDEGEVVGVGVQEVRLRDEHWGAIPETRVPRKVFWVVIQPAKTCVVDTTPELLPHWLVAGVEGVFSSVGKKAFVGHKLVALDALNVNFAFEGKSDASTKVVGEEVDVSFLKMGRVELPCAAMHMSALIREDTLGAEVPAVHLSFFHDSQRPTTTGVSKIINPHKM